MNTGTLTGGVVAIIRTVLGGSALAIGFGAAIALACLALGLVLRGVLELGLVLARVASSLGALVWTLAQ